MAMASPSLSSLSLKPSLGWTLPHSQALVSSPGPFRGYVRLRGTGIGVGVALVPTIECSSRPRKKATAHHVKTRPRKKQNSYDRRRKGPTKYPPLPKPPPIWGFDTSDVDGKPELKAVAKPVAVDLEAGTLVAANVENLPVSEAPDV